MVYNLDKTNHILHDNYFNIINEYKKDMQVPCAILNRDMITGHPLDIVRKIT
jgi:hypothetical protein